MRAVFERRAARLLAAGCYKRAYLALLGATHFEPAPVTSRAQQLPPASAGEHQGLGAFLSAQHSAAAMERADV